MKKITSIITIMALILTFFCIGTVNAASLDNLTVSVSKDLVRPGEEVRLSITFGEALGAYTFDIAYDNNIFDYVSVDGGTANDTSDKVRVTYYDSTGGTNPRQNMSIVFKAKENITTSNPTELTVVGDGLANSDASVTYDDITTPIVKNITVEPEYQDYEINLTYTGDIVVDEEKEMVISYSSSMGRYYEHARLVAEATTPEGANVKLIGKESTDSSEQDIIQSGWGEPQGYSIGGRNVKQVLNVNGLFTEAGEYGITLRLIDRENSDAIIAENQFELTAVNEVGEMPNEPEEPNLEEPTEKEEPKKPSTLPKAGYNIYAFILIIAISLIILAFIL